MCLLCPGPDFCLRSYLVRLARLGGLEVAPCIVIWSVVHPAVVVHQAQPATQLAQH